MEVFSGLKLQENISPFYTVYSVQAFRASVVPQRLHNRSKVKSTIFIKGVRWRCAMTRQSCDARTTCYEGNPPPGDSEAASSR